MANDAPRNAADKATKKTVAVGNIAMKKLPVLLIALLLTFANSIYAGDSICPPLPPLPEGFDDFRMTESTFTRKRFESSLSYFQTFLPDKLKNAEKTIELTGRSIFWISYRNGLKFIEGYMLKQAALLELASRNKRTKDKSAVEEFCRFTKDAEYVD